MERRFGKSRFDRNDRNDRGFNRREGGFRSGGFNERGDFPKPVNEGEEYDVEISEVGGKGDGIARVKNFVVFVPNVKEGEKCKIKIKTVRPRFAFAEKVSEGDVELKEPEIKKEEKIEEEEDVEVDLKQDEDLENEDEDLGDEDIGEN